MPFRHRTELLLFLACFFAFAYFNQGGGWNQNSRFAEVRAMAEEHRFAIDDFLVYLGDPATNDLVRVPVDHAEYEFDGKRHAMCWVDAEWSFFPISGKPAKTEGIIDEPMHMVCASGDLAYVPKTGHFHPNKPPGTSFLALPAYWTIWKIERALGINPDHWWTLNVNAWLTTIFSVGIISALGCVLFYRLACDFSGGEKTPALLATFALAFGTTFFPFGTILFDHNLTAMLLIASFYWLRHTPRPALAGFCAGFAVVTNYVAGGAVVALGLYALLAERRATAPGSWRWSRAIIYSLGGLLPAALLGWYHYVNFGSPTALNNDFQNPLFKDPSGSLGMFSTPSAYVGALLLVSPYRGIFFLAPILILGLYGLVRWLAERTFVSEARLCIAIFGFFFLINMSFNGYHGGYSAGPRYLVPGLPFLALPLVVAFVRWKKTALLLLAASIFHQFILTATDAQNALAVGGHARLDNEHRKDDFFCNIVSEYALPFFIQGRPEGLIHELLEARLDKEADHLQAAGTDDTEIEKQLAAKRAEWQGDIDRGEQDPFLLAALHGPVSINPVGVYDGLLGSGVFPLGSPPCEWASCNLGEFLWPQTRSSLIPLLLVTGGLGFAAFRSARKGSALSAPVRVA